MNTLHRAARALEWLCVLLVVCATACPAPRANPMDAALDGARSDVGVQRDAATPRRDAATDAPRSDAALDPTRTTYEFIGTDQLRLHSVLTDVTPHPNQCNGHPATGYVMGFDSLANSCRIGEWTYQSSGWVSRVNLRTGKREALIDWPPTTAQFVEARVACVGNRVAVLYARGNRIDSTPSRLFYDQVGLALFDDFDRPGRIVWQRSYVDDPMIGQGQSLQALGASTEMIMWQHAPTRAPPELWVSGPNGEDAHPIAPNEPGYGNRPEYLRVVGPHAVWLDGPQVRYWRKGDAQSQRINNTLGYRPWTDGRHAVWIGLASAEPRNMEVYLYDLQTRETRIISQDPAGQPTGQNYPTVEGDWVTYSDFRNARDPSPTAGFTDVMEILGYHIPTGRTVPILTGVLQAGFTRMFGDGLVHVKCQEQVPTRQFYPIALPLPSLRDE
ncbi:MAG: hypothetical protein Q8Q09_00725 [Deltaproteobacteria bacterium]|nr:hypothetical protein [Deltaproteobacteria bacterium]